MEVRARSVSSWEFPVAKITPRPSAAIRLPDRFRGCKSSRLSGCCGAVMNLQLQGSNLQFLNHHEEHPYQVK